MTPEERTARIRALNDELRRNVGTSRQPPHGRFMVTQGAAMLPMEQRIELMDAIHGFDDFDAGNDPHAEHDFGTVYVAGNKLFWKIDYYDAEGSHSVIYLRVDEDWVDETRDVLPATADPEDPEEVEVSRPSDLLEAQAAAESAFSTLFLGLGAVALFVGGGA